MLTLCNIGLIQTGTTHRWCGITMYGGFETHFQNRCCRSNLWFECLKPHLHHSDLCFYFSKDRKFEFEQEKQLPKICSDRSLLQFSHLAPRVKILFRCSDSGVSTSLIFGIGLTGQRSEQCKRYFRVLRCVMFCWEFNVSGDSEGFWGF